MKGKRLRATAQKTVVGLPITNTLPPSPKQCSMEMVRSDERTRTRMYEDGWMCRMETVLPSGEVSEIVIMRPDKGFMRSFDPINKRYRQAKLPKNLDRVFNPDSLFNWREDGFETIDGRKCRRFIGHSRKAKGLPGEAYHVCFIDAKTGMRRRVTGFDEKGEEGVVVDYLNAKVGRPPRKLFELPEGYKREYWT